MRESVIVFLFSFTLFVNSVFGACDVCSVTTTSGTYAPTTKICPGDLIFEDNFDDFDLKKWNHEQTLGGGGVRRFIRIIWRLYLQILCFVELGVSMVYE